MVALQNPPDNPCFGCGPRHPRGLRLAFERGVGADGTPEIRTAFTPQPDEIGWPGIFHTGLHFAVLYEVSYWTALTLGGRLMVSTGPGTYEHRRLPRVGRLHRAVARLGPPAPEGLVVAASSETADGRPCGSLRTYWRPVVREEIARAGLTLPAYLWDEIPASDEREARSDRPRSAQLATPGGRREGGPPPHAAPTARDRERGTAAPSSDIMAGIVPRAALPR